MAIKNGRLELVEKLQKLTLQNINIQIKCARIIIDNKKQEKNYLKVGHTFADFNEFCDKFDFNYDAGFCTKEHISGEIWLSDGSWLERCGYDGQEYWKHFTTPEIPKFLL